MKKVCKQIGFTIVELMATLAVAAILLAVGIPSYETLVKGSRLTTGNNDLVSGLNLARSEAVKRGMRVTVCKSANAVTAATPSCAAGDGWEQGWIIFTDQNSNAAYNSATETLLQVHDAMASSITAVGDATITSYISYVLTGQSQQTGGGLQSGAIKLCDDRTGDFGKNLVISTTGRIHTATEVTCP